MNCLEDILRRHKVQPVGMGYLDCICPREGAALFLEEVSTVGITVTDYSLWQYVLSPEEAVRGMGGPRCRYREGWYSELNVLRPWRGIEELEACLTAEEARLECRLVPGFWLEGPES